MPRQTSAVTIGNGAVMAVNIDHEVARNVTLPISRGWRIGIHAAVVQGVRVRVHQNHFADGSRVHHLTRCIGNYHKLPISFGSRAVTVQKVHHRIPAIGLACIAWGKIDEHVAFGRIAFQIPFKRASVNFDFLERPRSLGVAGLRVHIWLQPDQAAKVAAPASGKSVFQRKRVELDVIVILMQSTAGMLKVQRSFRIMLQLVGGLVLAA